MSSGEAYEKLVDAIRDELRQELKDELIKVIEDWRDSHSIDPDDAYFDGIDDAILTLKGA